MQVDSSQKRSAARKIVVALHKHVYSETMQIESTADPERRKLLRAARRKGEDNHKLRMRVRDDLIGRRTARSSWLLKRQGVRRPARRSAEQSIPQQDNAEQ